MFTEDILNKEWKEVNDYASSHMGMKYGDEFPQIAQILSKHKGFMVLGGIMQIMSAMHIASKQESVAKDGGVKAAEEIFDKANFLHETLAQMFYLGYKIGKVDAENEILKGMVKE